MQVADFLRQSHQKLVTCLPDDTLQVVANAMYAHGIGAMPVCEAGTRMVGIISERDLVRVRTNFRKETVYLYRLNSAPDNVRRLLMVYLKRINELADRPEFYHLLSNSCTVNIIRYANAAGRAGRFDIRHLVNGLIDSYLYHSGRVDTTLPFDELRRRSRINEAAQAADDAPDFSERIRASLPTITR